MSLEDVITFVFCFSLSFIIGKVQSYLLQKYSKVHKKEWMIQ
mgnify:CR=1 FL=1